MNTDIQTLLDQYVRGELSPAAVAELETRMENDIVFRRQVEQMQELRDSLKFYGQRRELKITLDQIHEELHATDKIIPINAQHPVTGWKKYWPMVAVAASVAFISIMGTLLMTRSIEVKQTAYYKELRRNVDQIKKSQKQLMQDITNLDNKKPAPARYAGTGFLLSANGYVVTSYHVVKESDSVFIENEKFGRLKVSVILNDAANDVSVLKIENDSVGLFGKNVPYAIVRNEASLGERVFTLGFPREDIVFGEGSISAGTGYGQNPNAYQISVPVNPGNSGGPLLNDNGDLVGIISGIQTETQGAAFAIKSSAIAEVISNASLDTLSHPLVLPKYAMKTTNRVQQVKRWKDFVFMVRVYKNQE
jgi:S1-C subfamily serine protease